MSSIFDLIAKGPYSLLADVDGEATVPAGAAVSSWSCSVETGGAAGTVDITPGGAGQTAVALPTITVPPGRAAGDDLVLGRLGAGTVFTFTGTDAYLITLFYPAGVAS